jgi:preprotein translocase subunit SecG
MQGLIALYVGFFIYLILFFRYKKKKMDCFADARNDKIERDCGNEGAERENLNETQYKMAKKITAFLAIKLIFLTILYFAFFAQKPSKQERQKNIEKILID